MKQRLGLALVFVTGLLLVAGSAAVRAQAEDPGPPPPADWDTAQPVEWDAAIPGHPGAQVLCSTNWCYVPGIDPGDASNVCLNTSGNACIVKPNSDAADAWFKAKRAYFDEIYGHGACTMFDTCPFFPENYFNDFCVPGSTDNPCPGDDNGDNGGGDGGQPVADCPAPWIQTWEIGVTVPDGGSEGGKMAPLNPVVVGQDPEKRGVDVGVQVQVPPVVYHYYEKIVKHELHCSKVDGGTGSGCPGPADKYANAWDESKVDNPNWKEQQVDIVQCIEHTRTYPDYVAWVQVNVSLSQESRNWILGPLQQAYPGAYLHHPDFTFFLQGRGTLMGDQTTVWSDVIRGIQTADPGEYHVTVMGMTTGTAVSDPRGFTGDLGRFPVYLLRVTLSSGD